MDTADSVLFVGIVLSFSIAMLGTLVYVVTIALDHIHKGTDYEESNWELIKIFFAFLTAPWFWGFIIFLLFNRLF